MSAPVAGAATAVSSSHVNTTTSLTLNAAAVGINLEIAATKERILAVEQDINEAIAKQKKHTEGDQLWLYYGEVLKQLRTEKELLLKKEERLCEELKAIKQDRAGE